MSEAEFKAAKVEGPKANVSAANGGRNIGRTVLVLPITASSVAFDILGLGSMDVAAYGTSKRLPLANKRIVKLIADVDTYYVWSDDSGGSISETAEDATTPETQCDLLPSKVPTHEYPSGRYLIIKGTSTGRLRITIASP